MNPINVNFLGNSKAAVIKDQGRVVSRGRKKKRVDLAPGSDNPEMRIALVSSKIYSRPPPPTILEKIFGRRYVLIKINDNNVGEVFIKLNAESLRKRLGLGSKEFKEMVKKHADRNLTEEIKPIISPINREPEKLLAAEPLKSASEDFENFSKQAAKHLKKTKDKPSHFM